MTGAADRRYPQRCMNSTPTLTLSAPEANLPPALSPLAELAYNLHWSWRPAVRDLFARIDPDEWEAGGHNPVRVLAHASPQRLATLAGDRAFVADAARAAEDHTPELAGPCWFDNAQGHR